MAKDMTKEGDVLLEETLESKYKLPHNDVGLMFPFPSRLVIEPRDADGKLLVERIGGDTLVTIATRIGTARGLSDLFFTYKL